MMRGKFWQGMLWGSLLVTVLGAVIGPMNKPQQKPLIEESKDAIAGVTKEFIREARRSRKRFLRKIH